ncbi:ABC transporter substrate-binding protein [Fuscibacter oryzae]|uniref:ABC transporter substrate-binding protein n=1 Tax=Fuscibacter oryzae TaxID=2803939 RepID=A0A8J7MS66_9RHOB|nr:ABC transporter substrate-binding protein [Fuscibacter oryzae]MBL4927428.1 ABC transporter substrate-binding protein [Fuscibacter oryzae]
MWACAKVFDLTLVLALASAAPALAEAPGRVVSINLCTDQLAMMLAAPGQLVSVSDLASEPQSSSMVRQAAGYAVNHGQAEEVFLMHPDLVLAGSYTALATVDMLRRLGIPVVQVPPANSLAEAVEQVRIVGAALGQEERAEWFATRFETSIRAARIAGPRYSAAFYHPNGYTTGSGTLADEVMGLTGFDNIAATAGVTGGGVLPLERLVMAAPEVLVTSEPYPGASRAEEVLTHPALRAVQDNAGATLHTDADWVCGTPLIMRAINGMRRAHIRLDCKDPGNWNSKMCRLDAQ